MNQNKKHLFLFTIGPVQSFISQARKTEDLYAGSQILSDLIKRAIEEVKRENIIFPFTSEKATLETIESVPNRLIAIIEDEDLKAFGIRVEDAIRKKWYGIATQSSLNCMKLIKKDNVSFKLKEAFFQQINQHLEIFWLFQPIESDNYKDAFLKIEQNLGAIKNVRSFKQYTYNGIGEKGRKCSIDGEQNALFFGEGTNDSYTSGKKWNPDACVLDGLPNVKVAKNEGLSAVSFAKRFYKDKSNEKQKFPSTAKIALLNLYANSFISSEIKEIKQLFGEVKFDEQLLFEENLNDTYFEKNGLDKKYLRKTRDHLKEIRKLAKDNSLKMNSYYALLSFDGDSMGEWLSKAKNEVEHRDFSELLVNFAEKAKAIVDKEGKTVYGGGDDFLGFVNLQGLFETIESLKAVFDAEVTQKVEIENGNKQFTMSMGVVIAHYKMPLGIVVKRAKEAEKAAKQSNDHKNSLAIDFITHSGSNRLGIIPFGENGVNLKKIKYIFEALKDNFSDKWIRNFAEEFYLFPDKENEMKLDEEFRPLMETELKRLILRAYKSSGEDKKAAAEALKNNAYELLQATDFNYSNFTEMLYITSALVSKTS